MPSEILTAPAQIACGVSSRLMPGQTLNGDLHLVKPFPGGALIAVVDGLGHGQEAAAAAAVAVSILRNHPDEPLATLVQRCHQALTETRGAVMTLATLNWPEGRLTWLGVGNVEAAVLLHTGDGAKGPWVRTLVLSNGVVGHRLPSLKPGTVPLSPKDSLILATDGVAPRFMEGVVGSDAPQRIADRILAKYFKGTDDGLALVVRYVGINHESKGA